MGRAYFVRYIQALLLGRGDEEALVYVNKNSLFLTGFGIFTWS